MCQWTAVASVGLASVGCASTSDPSESIGHTSQALLAGFADVSQDNGTSWERETAAAHAFSGVSYFGYNAGDERNTSYVSLGNGFEDRVTCAGTTVLGYSYQTSANGSWTAVHPSVPSGISVIWGDPAMVAFGDQVYLSALAVPNDRFTAAVNLSNFNGCVRLSKSPGSPYKQAVGDLNWFAGACIYFTSAAGSSPTLNPLQCVRIGNDFFDGGYMTKDGAGHVYAAYNDISLQQPGSIVQGSGTAVVYKATATGGNPSFAQIPNPPIATADHPLIVGSGSLLGLFVPSCTSSSCNNISYAIYSSTSNTWSTPLTVATNFDNSAVTLNTNGTQLRPGVPMAVSLMPEGSAGALIALAYQVVQNGKKSIQVDACTLVSPVFCTGLFTIGDGVNNYIEPALQYAATTSTNVVGISYWTDNNAGGNLSMQLAEFTSSGILNTRSAGTGTQIPCAVGAAHGSDGMPPEPDWGDFDSMLFDGTNWVRAASDSTGQACDSRDYRAFPLHVSAVTLPL